MANIRHLLAMTFGALTAAAVMQLATQPQPPAAPQTDDVTPLFIPDAATGDGPICTPIMNRLRLLGCPVIIV